MISAALRSKSAIPTDLKKVVCVSSIFTFPEINLILLAAILVIGRYSGYRLLELVRFRSIVEDAS